MLKLALKNTLPYYIIRIQLVYSIRIVTVRLREHQYMELKRLVESGDFKSISDVIRFALTEFISRRKLRWRSREELRKYLARKRKKFVASGRIIEDVRREDDWS